MGVKAVGVWNNMHSDICSLLSSQESNCVKTPLQMVYRLSPQVKEK